LVSLITSYARVGPLNQGFNLPNVFLHDLTNCFGLARVEPVLEIPVAIAAGTARAFGPSVHSTSTATLYSRLPARVTSAGLCPTSAGPVKCGAVPR
jgi:hypothetical protein